MEKIISKQFAYNGLLAVISLMVIFHLLNITQIVPNKIVWGVRMNSLNEILKFEYVSIFMNLIMPFRVAVNVQWFQLRVKPFIEKTSFCLMFIFLPIPWETYSPTMTLKNYFLARQRF